MTVRFCITAKNGDDEYVEVVLYEDDIDRFAVLTGWDYESKAFDVDEDLSIQIDPVNIRPRTEGSYSWETYAGDGHAYLTDGHYETIVDLIAEIFAE